MTTALCECGCGKPTTIVGGKPRRFIRFHRARLQNRDGIAEGDDYAVEERGYATPCWIWRRRTTEDGYGVVTRENRTQIAARYVYRLLVGEIPSGCQVHHLCEVTQCVNPEHLLPRTPVEHARIHNAKLTIDQVGEVKRAVESQRKLAARFGVSRSTIQRIQQGTNWR